MQLHSFFVQLQAFPVQLQVSDNKQIHETHLLGAVFVVFLFSVWGTSACYLLRFGAKNMQFAEWWS